MPVTDRAPSTPIVHAKLPAGTPVESQVQSPLGPTPEPRAISKPALVTTTFHGCADESPARKRTAVPSTSVRGSKILGRPMARAAAARVPSFAYKASPGHSVYPVSRWPDTAFRSTAIPLA